MRVQSMYRNVVYRTQESSLWPLTEEQSESILIEYEVDVCQSTVLILHDELGSCMYKYVVSTAGFTAQILQTPRVWAVGQETEWLSQVPLSKVEPANDIIII